MRRGAFLVVAGVMAAVIVLGVFLVLSKAGSPGLVRESMPAIATYQIPATPPSAPEALTALAAPPPAKIIGSEDGAGGPGGPVVTDALRVQVPQLAYAYTLGYRLPGDAIAAAQGAHLALCTRLGPTRCQLLAMERKSDDDGNSAASMKLRVASAIAPSFSSELGKAITAAGGRAADTNVTAEDVSKELVDTDARIRQREILVERLTAMLRNRQGRVSELVEAERSVAQAQEELDQAKGWLRELRGRVAFSDFTVSYVPMSAAAPTPRGFGERLRETVMQSGSFVLLSFTALLYLTVFLLPWAVIVTPFGLYLWRRRQRRQRPAVAGYTKFH